MKYSVIRSILLAVLVVLLILVNLPFQSKKDIKTFTIPGLPQPIAEVPIAITSAGQNTDTYIMRDISNQLMLTSYFMPQARDTDMKDINTLVFVIGYSSLGTKLQNVSFDEEKMRIEKLLEKAKEEKMRVLTVIIGGEGFYDKNTEEFLRLVGAQTDYLIGLRDSNYCGILIELAKERDIPLTLAASIKDISGPFASAFR